MIGCFRTRVSKQPIIALYFESENELKFYNLEARFTVKDIAHSVGISSDQRIRFRLSSENLERFLLGVPPSLD